MQNFAKPCSGGVNATAGLYDAPLSWPRVPTCLSDNLSEGLVPETAYMARVYLLRTFSAAGSRNYTRGVGLLSRERRALP